jgi:2-dehydropantoate 2-reductase
MRFVVVGAGAIGGYLGAKLALSRHEVTFVARGASLEAIRARGMRLILEDESEEVAREVSVAGRPDQAGTCDVVILAVKAHQVAALAADLGALCREETAIMTTQNGIPWWYFHKVGGPFEGVSIRASDPDGTIARNIDPQRIIGSVVYPAAELVAPGVVKIIEGNRFTLGELDGAMTARASALSSALTTAGFRAPVVKDIRNEIWLKLWGAMSFNPISALTHATLAELCEHAETRALAAAMMREAQAVGEKLGVTFKVSVEKRILGAQRVGAHKTSMLQDVEHGRTLELEAIVGAVAELARLTHTPVPHIDAVYACATLLAKTLMDRGSRLRMEELPSNTK